MPRKLFSDSWGFYQKCRVDRVLLKEEAGTQKKVQERECRISRTLDKRWLAEFFQATFGCFQEEHVPLGAKDLTTLTASLWGHSKHLCYLFAPWFTEKKMLRDPEEQIKYQAKESHDIPEEAGSLGDRNSDVISRDVQALIDGT